MTFRQSVRRHPIPATIVGILLLFALFLQLFVVRASFGDGPIDGRVIDIDTNQPLADAIVIALWQKSSFGIGHSTSYCIHAETAVSGADGGYHVARWWQFPPILGWDGLIGMDAYRPGYESVHSHTPEAKRHPEYVYMRKYVGTDAERFDYIAYRVFGGMNCTEARASRRNLFLLFKTAYREAAPLAVTEKQRDLLEGGLRVIAAWSWLAPPPEAVGGGGDDPIELLPKDIRSELQ